jgi:hypothetical protein
LKWRFKKFFFNLAIEKTKAFFRLNTKKKMNETKTNEDFGRAFQMVKKCMKEIKISSDEFHLLTGFDESWPSVSSLNEGHCVVGLWKEAVKKWPINLVLGNDGIPKFLIQDGDLVRKLCGSYCYNGNGRKKAAKEWSEAFFQTFEQVEKCEFPQDKYGYQQTAIHIRKRV